jgi:anti-anti-sigma factor
MPTSLSSTRAPSPAPEAARRVPRIEVSVREAPGEVVVRLAGEASFGLAGELAGVLLCVSVRRPPLVTLDLSGLTFVSCLALGALVAFRRGVVGAGGRFRLAAALQEPVRASLERAGLLTLFGWPEGVEVAPLTQC